MIKLRPVEPESAEILAPFDYKALKPAASKLAKAAADFISVRNRSWARTVIEIGQKLIEVKDALDHGQFTGWLEAEFGWSDRSAQNYMKAAQAFGSKSETVADLPVMTVYALARASEPVREKVLERIATAPMPVEAVREMLSDEKKAERTAQAEARKSPEQKRKEKAKRDRRQREWERERQESDERRAAEGAADSRVAVLIVERFGDSLPELLGALQNGSSFSDLLRWLKAPYGAEFIGGNWVAKSKPQ